MSNIPRKEMSIEDIERVLGYKIKIVPRTRTQVVNVPAGEVFQIDNIEFVVLKNGVKVLAITKEPIGTEIFDKNSNSYEHSALHLSKLLNDFEASIIKAIDANNLIQRRVDLAADNGVKDYDCTTDSVAPMTLDEFRQFIDIMEKHRIDEDWWLITPHGTWNHNESKDVCYVNGNNMVEHAKCDTVMAIRPVICLNCATIVGYDGEKRN